MAYSDISSINSVASRDYNVEHDIHAGASSAESGTPINGTNDISATNGAANNGNSPDYQNMGGVPSGSASYESGQPINGTNDISATNMTATLSIKSNEISAGISNKGTGYGTRALF